MVVALKCPPEICQCTTFETKVNGCKANIILDIRSFGNFISPAFTRVMEINAFPLKQQLTRLALAVDLKSLMIEVRN